MKYKSKITSIICSICFIIFFMTSCGGTQIVILDSFDMVKSGTHVADYFESSSSLFCFVPSLDTRGLGGLRPVSTHENAGYSKGHDPGTLPFPCPMRWAFVSQALFKWNLDDLVSELDDRTEVINVELLLVVRRSENTCPPEVGERCKCSLTVFAATEDWPEGFSFESQNDAEISKMRRAEIGGWGLVSRTFYNHTIHGLTGYVKDWLDGTRDNHGLIIQPSSHPLPGGDLRVDFTAKCEAQVLDSPRLRVTLGRSR